MMPCDRYFDQVIFPKIDLKSIGRLVLAESIGDLDIRMALGFSGNIKVVATLVRWI